ncbi:unnamed protein product [Acidithrix sp. C25]|nr:unnamed protein product [Acidithrix sp. C25]
MRTFDERESLILNKETNESNSFAMTVRSHHAETFAYCDSRV